MQNNKMHGNDGLTKKIVCMFFQRIWEIVGENDELSKSQKKLVIILIKKKDKDSRLIKNLAPIP